MRVDRQHQPQSITLFRQEEGFLRHAKNLLHRPMPRRLTIVAIVATLLLLPADEEHRGLKSGEDIVAASGSPAVTATMQPARPQPAIETVEDGYTHLKLPRKTDRGVESKAVMTSTAESASIDGWLSMLYPELSRIVELENQPAGAAVAELLPMLGDDDPVVRLAALEALADLGSAVPLAALTPALYDINPQVRLVAIEALALDENPAAAASIEARVFDSDRRVRIAAIDALAAIAAATSVPVLGGLLYDADRSVRSSALAALGEIGGPRAMRYLDPLRHDPDDDIRASARAILHEAGLAAGH